MMRIPAIKSICWMSPITKKRTRLLQFVLSCVFKWLTEEKIGREGADY